MSGLAPILALSLGLQHAAPAAASRTHDEPASPLQVVVDGAADGAVVRVPPGTYPGFLRLDRRVSLVADGECILDGGGIGDIVEVSAAGASLRGFTLRNTGIDLDQEHCAIRVTAPDVVVEGNRLEDVLFGIDLRLAPGATVRGNTIGGKALDPARRGDGLRAWKSDGSVFEENLVHDGRDAVLWYSSGVVVRGNTSLRCRYGLHLMYCDGVRIERNALEGNSVGIYIMYSRGIELRGNRIECNRGPSGYGIGLKEADGYEIEGNLIAGNCAGIYMDDSPFKTGGVARIEGNTIAQNTIGLSLLPNVRGNRIVGNSFLDNVEQVRVQGRGGVDANEFSLAQAGNFWSDYAGYDLDGDGVGEFAHEPADLYEHLMDREPKLRAFLFSPAQAAVEFVARALPAVRPEPKFADDYPLTQPPEAASASAVPLVPGERHGAAGLVRTAGILLWVAAALAAGAFSRDIAERLTGRSTACGGGAP